MKNHIKTTLIALCLTVLAVFLLLFTLAIPGRHGEVLVEMVSAPWEILETRKGFLMEMEGFHNYGGPGLPILPSKIYRFLLPPNKTLINTKIEERVKRPIQIKGEWSLGSPVYRDVNIKGEKGYIGHFDPWRKYPESNFEILDQSRYGHYNCVTIRFYPCQWIRDKQTIVMTENLVLRLIYKEDISTRGLGAQRKWLPEQEVPCFFDNYYNMQQYYDKNKLDISSIGKYLLKPKWDYVIITTDKIYSEAQTAIDTFKEHKQSLGFSVKIVTENTYGTYPGDNVTEQIREFLKDRYIDWGIEYVLIIAGDSDIPMKRVLPTQQDQIGIFDTPTDLPTDWYFSDLNGNWDKDGDSISGEYGDDIGIGGVDFNAEIVVGRIPYGWAPKSVNLLPFGSSDLEGYQNKAENEENVNRASEQNPERDFYPEKELKKILQRTANYEEDSLSISVDNTWKYNILLIGAIGFYYDGSIIGDGASIMEHLDEDILLPNNFMSYKLYEPGKGSIGSPPSELYQYADAPLNYDNVLAELGSGHGVIFWSGHGSPYSTVRKLINTADGSIESIDFINTKGITSIFDTNLAPIIYSMSCNNSYPEYYNLMRVLLENLCVATFGATREILIAVSPFEDLSDNKSILFARNLLENQMSCGDAISKMKEDYFNLYATTGSGLNNAYTYTLYGDPSLKLFRESFVYCNNFPQQLKGLEPWKIDLLKQARASNLKRCLRDKPSYKRIYDLLKRTNKLIPALLIDIDNDGLGEWIIFPDAERTAKALVFENPEEGSGYLGSMRFPRKLLNEYIQQLNRDIFTFNKLIELSKIETVEKSL